MGFDPVTLEVCWNRLIAVVNARHPAPVVARAVIGHFLPHPVSDTLSQAIPGRVMAEGSANIWILHVTGKDLASKPFVLHVINSIRSRCGRTPAGRGRHRGGLGQTIAFRVRTDQPWTCSVLCDRTREPARGLFGGAPSAPGEVWVNGTRPARAKAEHVLAPDPRVEIRLPGGGGYGDPAERPIELRQRDLRAGYVTAATTG